MSNVFRLAINRDLTGPDNRHPFRAKSRREQMPRRAVLFDHLISAGEQRRGTSRPSAFAVLRLMTSSYLVGACTGRSAGFSPLGCEFCVAASRDAARVHTIGRCPAM